MNFHPGTFLLFGSFTIFLFSCKKEKDTVAPVISIVSPSLNASFQVSDTIPVEARISDDKKLEYATIQLLNDDLTPGGELEKFSTPGNSFQLKTGYILDDISLLTGNYYLRISATDGVNETREYVKIFISEAPTILQEIILISLTSYSTIDVSVLSNNNALSQFATISGIYAGSCISSKDQYLNVLAEISPGLNSYKMSDKTLQWNVQPVGAYTYFEGLDFFDEISFVCHSGGSVKGYDKAGIQQYNFPGSNGYIPEQSFLINSKLIVAENAVSGSTQRLVVYYGSGSVQHTYTLPFTVIDFAKKDNDTVFLFGNGSANASIRLYSISNNSSTTTYTISSGYFINDAILINSNTFLLAMEDGVYKYQYSPSTFTQFISLAAEKIAYDSVNNTVYCVNGSTLRAYNYSSGQQVRFYTHNNSIRDFHLLYNK